MRIASFVMTLLALNGNATAADVTVYVASQGNTSTYAAKRIAESVFRKSGLTLAWETQAPTIGGTPGIWLRVILAEQTPDERLPGALAVAHPYDCTKTITVFNDRIRSIARRPELESALLAYVLVHEITHVLQRVERHSDEGVMKASWSPDDRAKIFARRLTLIEEDIQLIRQGLAAGCRRQFTDRSESGIAAHPE
jgi:hypothetical protein